LRRFAILMVVLMLGIGTAAAGERMTVKADKGNVRSGPGVKYELLWQVERYYPVNVIEKKGEWCRFKDFEGDVGWLHSTLLDKTPAVIVRVRNGNVRTEPSTKADVAFSVGRGIPFKVIEKKGDWFHVRHADGDEGWIYKTLLW